MDKPQPPRTEPWLSRSVCVLLLMAVAMVGSGCTSLPELQPMAHVPAAPGKASKPQATPERSTPRSSLQQPPALPAEVLPSIPPGLQSVAAGDGLTLPQLVDEALRINPHTKRAWEHARAAAAGWAVSRGSYYPTVTGTAIGGVAEATGKALKGINPFERQEFGGVALSLDYLLLDFGSRSAQAEAARQALLAAKWNHNQSIQDVLRHVAQAFYALLGARAHLAAIEVSLTDARTGLEAAQARLEVGEGTLPEMLQARARLERVRFERAAARGQVEITRSQLATAVGWPANTPFNIAVEPDELPLAAMAQNVEALIEQAQQHRPDLAAFRAAAQQQEAKVRQATSALYPKITANATGGWTTIDRFTIDGDNDLRAYTVGVEITVPIFEGFVRRNTVRKAVAELEVARTALRIQAQSVVEEVWNAYHHFRTASQQVKASKALLASATESYSASLERYRVGAGDVVELLNAQGALANARALRVQARSDLRTSYVALIHAIGADLPTAPSGGRIKPVRRIR